MVRNETVWYEKIMFEKLTHSSLIHYWFEWNVGKKLKSNEIDNIKVDLRGK